MYVWYIPVSESIVIENPMTKYYSWIMKEDGTGFIEKRKTLYEYAAFLGEF